MIILTFRNTESTKRIQLPNFAGRSTFACEFKSWCGHASFNKTRTDSVDPDIRSLQLVNTGLCQIVDAANESEARHENWLKMRTLICLRCLS
jgi:hypothetical protein